MSYDLEFSFASSAMQRVFSDLKYPFVITDEKEDFDPDDASVYQFRGSATYRLSKEEFSAILNNKSSDEGIQRIKDTVNDNLSTLDEYIEDIEEAVASGQHVDGVSIEELKQMKNTGDWDVEFHLAWIRVILKTEPKVQLSSPETKLNRVRVEVSATGELWIKYPWPKCKKRCKKPAHKLCCSWKKITKWDRIVRLTVRNIDLSADVSLHLSSDEKFNIVSKTRYRKLRIDKDIFDKIPLEGLANLLLDRSDSRETIIDSETFFWNLDEFGLKYGPKSVALPSNSAGLTVQVVLQRI